MSVNVPQGTGGGGKGKLYTGLFNATVIAINPTQAELNAIFKGNKEGEISYNGEYDGHRNARIDVFFKTANGIILKHHFFLTDRLRESQTGSNMMWVNEVGDITWATSGQEIQSEDRHQYFRQRDFRRAYDGEDALYNFMQSWLIYSRKDLTQDSQIQIELQPLFNGDFSELQACVNIYKEKEITGLATVVTKQVGTETKTYQGIWRDLLPAWGKQALEKGDQGFIIKKWVEKVESAQYGCKDYYHGLSSLKEYDPSQNPAVAGGAMIASTPQAAPVPQQYNGQPDDLPF